MFTLKISLKNNTALIVFAMLMLMPGLNGRTFAQQDEQKEHQDLFEMSMEDLMEIEIGVASKRETTERQAPGIVTVITRDQIQKSGARDLIDILRLVPGFDVGFDTAGAYGVAIRGIWANEGKVLVLIDGVPLNDEMYSTFQYGHHIPVDIIDRIEIMRGPGSVMYGESAELGVISIKTMKPQKENDIFVSTTYSRMEETFGRQTVTSFYGTKKDDFSMSIASHYGRGNFTDRTVENYDLSGTSYDLGHDNNSQVRSPFFNIAASWGNFSARSIIDRYSLNSPWPGAGMYRMRFHSDIYQFQYKLPVTDNLYINSRFLYKHQKPWNWPHNAWGQNKLVSDKYTTDIYLSWDLNGGHNIVLGTEYDQIKGKDETGDTFDKASYNNWALYGEGLFKTPFGNLTAGARYVDHSHSGSKLLPRFALTNVFDNFHVKLLYSKAYRAASIMNIVYNENIKPEETTIYEVEVGTQISDSISVTANAFDVEVEDPIIYYYDNNLSQSLYGNFERVGSRGIELEAKYKKNIYDVGLAFSWYEANDNKVDEYAVPNENDLLLGFSAYKASLYASVNLAEDLYLTPTIIYHSPKYAVTDYGSDYVYKKLGSSILTNISLLKRNAFNKKGLDLSFSVYNMFNEGFDFVQPYLGWYAPIPGPPRSFIFTLSYNF
ncbi:MAG: TonB-dependent receptor plug domain-containing protein [Planctomycetota bacterium]|jgi:outer membrane receptor for ferrienterochelin and colicin